MKTIPRDKVEQALYDSQIGFESPDEVIRDGYSGRGMYGAECFGFVCDIRDLLKIFVALSGQNDPDDDEFEWTVMELTESATSDSMGSGTIWYFPGWTLS
jgi:hypothetical protein